MPADGLTSSAPLPGVIVTRGAGAVALAVGLAAAAGLAWVVPCPLPVQAAASRASAVMAAPPAVRRIAIFLVATISGLPRPPAPVDGVQRDGLGRAQA